MNEHLAALRLRLSNEKIRYASDKTPIRKVWIAGIEKEIAAEIKFLGIGATEETISDDELLNELLG